MEGVVSGLQSGVAGLQLGNGSLNSSRSSTRRLFSGWFKMAALKEEPPTKNSSRIA
jgi:hypothetical protein